MKRLRFWWTEERPVFWIRDGWQWGWLGNGWNGLALGKVRIWFASGPSPAARLRASLRGLQSALSEFERGV